MAATPAATSGDLDLHGLLLSVVAEKTGYPTEMLSMDMDLESDLGIDSIKRVEILSAITENAPNLPDIDPAAMADLTEIGMIFIRCDGGISHHPAESITEDDAITGAQLLLNVLQNFDEQP